MLTFQDRAEGRGKLENASIFRDELKSLKSQVPDLLGIEVYLDEQVSKGSADLIYSTRHLDRAHLTQFLNHPAFLKISQLSQQLVASSSVVDYNTGTFAG